MKDEDRNEGGRILNILIGLIFLAYLLVLIKITLIKGTTLPRILQNLMTGTGLVRSMNLVPFKTISDYLQYRDTMSFRRR
jgi:glycopeptide antibiotics resistance protein